MADPNTQIDWWIAQAWQEAQGGADSDALVAWLHENGLTAVSSYTILQAALSCSSEEAKQMVFGHPAWAGADAEADLSGAEYTSDTLEPEPEPDATFGLDDWADEIEEDEPVYGEPGYEPPPSATPARASGSESETPPQRSMLLDAYAETVTDEEAISEEPDQTELETELDDDGDILQRKESQAGQSPSFASEAPYQDCEPEPVAEAEPESMPLPETEDFGEDEPEIDADQVFDIEPEWESEPASREPAPVASMVPSAGISARTESEASRTGASSDAVPAAVEEPVSAPAPMAPPILRMPPATPAERRATFAAAFGKKPTTPPGQTAHGAGSPGSFADGGPPSNDLGPAAHAETAPAQVLADSPLPAPAAAPIPQPLVLEPVPEYTAPPPVTPVEPLFTATSPREPAAAPPLFPPSSDQLAAEVLPEAPPANNGPVPDDSFEVEAEFPDSGPVPVERETADSGDSLAEPDIEEVSESLPAETMAEGPPFDEPVDEEPGNEEFDVSPGTLEDDIEQQRQADEEDEVPEIDREEELPDIEIEEPEESEDPGDDIDADADETLATDEAAEHPRKRVLLDSSEQEPAEPDLAGDHEDLSEAAKKLGINFREADAAEIGIDPELSKAAKELGISFRSETTGPVEDDDGAALEAQKLGISFRENTNDGNPPKPLIVKYLPMLLGMIVIFFLLLIAATFAGDIIGWLKS